MKKIYARTRDINRIYIYIYNIIYTQYCVRVSIYYIYYIYILLSQSVFDQNRTDRANGHRTMTAACWSIGSFTGCHAIRGSARRSRPPKLPFPSRCSQIAYAGPRATRIVVFLRRRRRRRLSMTMTMTVVQYLM
jgi:hypothetical protein